MQSGFTLIEVFVALSVFGVLSLLAYMSLGQTLANADMLNARMDRLQSIQRTVSYLSSELLQTVPRPVRVDLGDAPVPALQSSFGTDFALQLTHGGWPNSIGVPRSTLQRTAYRIEDDELIRYHWNVLDRTVNSTPITTVMLEEVESLTFRFLQQTDEWTEQWPPLSAQGAQGTQSGNLPRAVEIVLTLADEGEISRVIEVSP
ncbi:MAG: type II secretion system minor pseudopilin GspJ [Gammaproteobacteria bacterium]|nr:type II secretion system minor pseudopilin GspJ [Gammaproteobacteria bacterium]